MTKTRKFYSPVQYIGQIARLLAIAMTMLGPLSKTWAAEPVDFLECRQSLEGFAAFELPPHQYESFQLLQRSKSRLQLSELKFFSGDMGITPPALWFVQKDSIFRLRVSSDGKSELQKLKTPRIGIGKLTRLKIEDVKVTLTRSPKGRLWIDRIDSEMSVQVRENIRKRKRLPPAPEAEGLPLTQNTEWEGIATWDEAMARQEMSVLMRLTDTILGNLSKRKFYDEDLELVQYLGLTHYERLRKSRLEALKSCEAVIPLEVLKALQSQVERLLDPKALGFVTQP